MAEGPLLASAPAKVNLLLRVRERDASGLHPLLSLVQAVDLVDELRARSSEEDTLVVEGAELSTGNDNLVWKAVAALRAQTGRSKPALAFHLHKRIPVAAGLGGGSADAAAALLLAAQLLEVPDEEARAVAPTVGGDVPFALLGGLARMEGYGAILTPLRPLPADFHLAVVVPPFELATAAVYDAWDRLEGPTGPPVAGRHLPPSLRGFEPLGNDLYPAAVALAPELAEWRGLLEELWGRAVLLSGSGPALFAFFPRADEAADAAAAAPAEARAAAAAAPRARGAVLVAEEQGGEPGSQ